MSRRTLTLVPALCLFLNVCLLSSAGATRSRLSGMGDLSIVIEDESNMINLWDFGRNPAGFLADEKGSVIRGDFLWDTYQIRDLLYYDYDHAFSYSKYNADGDILDNKISFGFRRNDRFALGVQGNYIFSQSECKYYKNKLEFPTIFFTFTHNVNLLTSLGADLKYLEYNAEYRGRTYESKDQEKFRFFQAAVGVERKLSPGVILGALLGYNSVKPEENSGLPESYALWLSGQTVVEIENKLKLGVKTTYRFRRGDSKRFPSFGGKGYKEDYHYSSLRFRGIYSLSSELRIGLIYFDNELFGGFSDPLMKPDVAPPHYKVYIRHLGIGCSYRFSEKMLTGVEYHFRDSSRPDEIRPSLALKNESLNLGVESKVTEGFTIRGGFIRAEKNSNPNYDRRRDTWENILTFGFGYEPEGLNLIVEFSYGYAFKKFKQSPGDGDTEADKQTFSLSFKKEL